MGNTIKIEFKERAKITQQKGRIVPFQLQKAVDVKNSLEAGRKKELDQITDEMLVYSAGGNTSQKRPKCQNSTRCQVAEYCHFEKEKYQMPNLENWTEKEAEIVNATEEGDVFSTSLDMQYAFEQTVLRPETAKHCNFQIAGGESTGTYAFNMVFLD